jgi:hypothetical protein
MNTALSSYKENYQGELVGYQYKLWLIFCNQKALHFCSAFMVNLYIYFILLFSFVCPFLLEFVPVLGF